MRKALDKCAKVRYNDNGVLQFAEHSRSAERKPLHAARGLRKEVNHLRRYIELDPYEKQPPMLCEYDADTRQLFRKELTQEQADEMQKAAHARKRERLDGSKPGQC